MNVREGDIDVCFWFGAPILHSDFLVLIWLNMACRLWACAFKEPFMDCLCWRFVV